MNVSIAPLSESQFEQLREVLDTVARERRYLAVLQAPPPEQSFAFYRGLLAQGQCHVALDGTRVVGWCDIQPAFGEARQQPGADAAMPALGKQAHAKRAHVLAAAVATAWSRGLSRIELTVREDNLDAKALYERLGFQNEGIKRQCMRVDGRFYDCHAMALLRQHGT
jgi:ribosomal protein S18 acetylase RimI-like enzyme